MSRLGHIFWGIVYVIVGIMVLAGILRTATVVVAAAKSAGARKTILSVLFGLVVCALLAVLVYIIYRNFPAIIRWLTEPV